MYSRKKTRDKNNFEKLTITIKIVTRDKKRTSINLKYYKL